MGNDITIDIPITRSEIELRSVFLDYELNKITVNFALGSMENGVFVMKEVDMVSDNVQPDSQVETEMKNIKASALGMITATKYPGTINK